MWQHKLAGTPLNGSFNMDSDIVKGLDGDEVIGEWRRKVKAECEGGGDRGQCRVEGFEMSVLTPLSWEDVLVM